MPELPEVETVVRTLRPRLQGRRILSVDVAAPAAVGGQAAAFVRAVAGTRVTGLRRRAKLVLIDLDSGGTLAVHLKMTGRLLIKSEHEPHRHDRVRLGLDSGDILVFADMRTFGSLRHFPPGGLESWPFYRDLGPEPLGMAEAEFVDRLVGRNSAVKALLLDQTVVVGIGNIYADESLFRARIHPAARASSLTPARLRRLFAAVQAVLTQAIAENGSSIRDYLDAEGNAGGFQNSFKVYGKKGEPCPVCRAELQATKVAGRTSTFCPQCQKGEVPAGRKGGRSKR